MHRLSAVLCAASLTALAACSDSASSPAAPATPSAPPSQPAAAPSAPVAPPTTATDRVAESTFDVTTTPGGPHRVGQLARFGVALTTKNGWHVNEEFPIRLVVTPPAGVTLPKAELTRPDCAEFTQTAARFDVPFTATTAGRHRIEAKLEFAVCTDENCVPDERTLAFELPVE